VFAVPPRAAAVPAPVRRLVFATDFSAASLTALDAALRLLPADVRITVLHVIDDASEYDLFVARPYDVHRHMQLLERHVSDSLARLARERFEGRVAASQRVAHGRAAEQILAVASEVGADLLVMGVHGRRALDVAIFGSTTNHVVRHASCPVLTAKA
jgi:nucleotide-binding universal stress UspA family protein